MHVDMPVSVLYSFLLLLARVGSAFAFIPLPVWRSGPAAPRVAIILGITIALLPVIQMPPGGVPGLWSLAAILFSEAAIGVAAGAAVLFLCEAFTFAAQLLALQAGFSYATTIDPTSQADSGVLATLANLGATLLFLALGMDHTLLLAFSDSYRVVPPGSFVPTMEAAQSLLRLMSYLLFLGLRLCVPILVLLFLVDFLLGLLARVNAHLQLVSLAMPVKMLLALVLLASVYGMQPMLFRTGAEETTRVLRTLMGVAR